ncbi:MAG: precorrin-4 C(11)-methyltransferase, partial [Dermatophilaceae bacterium]
VTRTREVMAELEATHGADCPVAVVYRASQPEERVLRGSVSTIADAVEDAGLRQAAVILVGRALGTDDAAGESHLYDPRRDRPCAP